MGKRGNTGPAASKGRKDVPLSHQPVLVLLITQVRRKVLPGEGCLAPLMGLPNKLSPLVLDGLGRLSVLGISVFRI